MGVIAEALMMRLRALVYPRLLTNKDILRFRSLFYLGLKCVFFGGGGIYLWLPKVSLCSGACSDAMLRLCSTSGPVHYCAHQLGLFLRLCFKCVTVPALFACVHDIL